MNILVTDEMSLFKKENNLKENTIRHLILAIIANTVIIAFEMTFGIMLGSLALITDAFHNFFDIASLCLSIFGEKIASRPADLKKTYGYKRAEIIIAFINSSILVAVLLHIFILSFQRLFRPNFVKGIDIAWVATVAFIGNGLASYFLKRDSHKNLNIKSAWLHSMQDTLFSLGVLIGALIIHFTGWHRIDPIISLSLCLFIIYEALKLIIDAVNVLMDSVPEDVDFNQVKEDILQLEGIKEVKDLHIWQISSKSRLLTVHIKIFKLEDADRIELIHKIQKLALEKYRIDHTTIQTAPDQAIEEYCDHCN